MKDTEKDSESTNPFEKMVVEKRLRDVFSKNKKHRRLFVPFYFPILLLYLELVFHVYSFHSINLNIIGIILFSTAIAGLIGFLSSLCPPKINYALTIFFTALICVYFCVQIVYKGVFQNYLSLSAMNEVTGQAFDYWDTIMTNVWENIVAIILLLVPLVLICTPLRKLLDYQRKNWIHIACHFVVPFAVYALGVIFLQITNKPDPSGYSAYDVYKEYISIDMLIERLGVSEGSLLDFGALIGIEYESNENFEYIDAFSEAAQNTPQADNTDIDTEPGDIIDPEVAEEVIPRKPTNVLEIDFDSLIAATNDKTLISMNEYFKNCVPTNTNNYTGMFEGYNVIFITAEGFSGYALTEENYPTLYKMANEGFVFKNYYTPLWYGSTVGGEYANLTGLMPENGKYLSLKETGKRKNSMRLTLATQLANLGYTTIGYHNNSYTYYGRDMSHTNMGYTWVGVGNGYEPERNKSGKALWPQSDDRMIQTTFYDYCDTEPFHIYYLSVSGHVQYNFSGNAMAIRNKEVFADTDYSETTKAYLSCQYELEKAMTTLVSYLEEEGIADHTVIVLAPDHVPYDNKDVCDELAGHELEDNFEWFENTLIMWSASMKEPVEVDKVCSSIDILPTISNLLGLDFDSRLLVGRDILSDTEGLVMFNNRSWITDSCMYNAKNGEITYLTEDKVSDEYIKAVKSTVKTRFKIAENILEYDYYSYIEDLFEPYDRIVPVKVADKMAEAGYHTDGTQMSSSEIKEFEKRKAEELMNAPEDTNPSEGTDAEAIDKDTSMTQPSQKNSGTGSDNTPIPGTY